MLVFLFDISLDNLRKLFEYNNSYYIKVRRLPSMSHNQPLKVNAYLAMIVIVKTWVERK